MHADRPDAITIVAQRKRNVKMEYKSTGILSLQNKDNIPASQEERIFLFFGMGILIPYDCFSQMLDYLPNRKVLTLDNHHDTQCISPIATIMSEKSVSTRTIALVEETD